MANLDELFNTIQFGQETTSAPVSGPTSAGPGGFNIPAGTPLSLVDDLIRYYTALAQMEQQRQLAQARLDLEGQKYDPLTLGLTAGMDLLGQGVNQYFTGKNALAAQQAQRDAQLQQLKLAHALKMAELNVGRATKQDELAFEREKFTTEFGATQGANEAFRRGMQPIPQKSRPRFSGPITDPHGKGLEQPSGPMDPYERMVTPSRADVLSRTPNAHLVNKDLMGAFPGAPDPLDQLRQAELMRKLQAPELGRAPNQIDIARQAGKSPQEILEFLREMQIASKGTAPGVPAPTTDRTEQFIGQSRTPITRRETTRDIPFRGVSGTSPTRGSLPDLMEKIQADPRYSPAQRQELIDLLNRLYQAYR